MTYRLYKTHRNEAIMQKLEIMILALSILILLLVNNVMAQTWHTANQQTVAWDAVTTSIEGNIIPPEQISYAVYLCNATTDPDLKNPVRIETTNQLSSLVTLGVEGRYFIGVQAIRTVKNEVVGESSIVWSRDDPYNFGLQYFAAPRDPTGLNLP